MTDLLVVPLAGLGWLMFGPAAIVGLLLDVIRVPFDGFNWLTDELFLLMNDLFNRFGVPIVFVSALAEAIVGIGVVFPGLVIMFLGGAYAAGDGASLASVFVFAVLGTAIGDTISYGLGRYGSGWLGRTRLGPSLSMGAALLEGRALWLIPFYHLYSVTRAVGPFGSGVLRLPLRVWMPLDYLGAVVSNTVWIGAGAILGATLLNEDGTLDQHPALRIGLIVLGVVWFVVLRQVFTRRIRQIRDEREQTADALPQEQAAGD